jgi:murein L,D-transpeptidase YafK
MIMKNSIFIFAFLCLFLFQDIHAKTRSQIAADNVRPALTRDLKKQSLAIGNPVFIRIFKSEKKLELWLKQQNHYVLFRSYPICTYSGALGPKIKQGDGQSPEGFYRVGLGQLNPASSYHLAFNLGYPNAYDKAHQRTGDFLMVHGNCVSIGCYAMGDENIEEIYTLMEAALRKGQPQINVHVFPFDFDSTNLNWKASPWAAFWKNLQQGYQAFNASKLPPTVNVKDKRYVVVGSP